MFDISLHPAHNDDGFPALSIDLRRDDHPAGSVYVRFPERIDARIPSGESLRLYKDGRSPEWPAELACEPLQIPPTWEGDAKDTFFRMAFDNGMALEAGATVRESRIDFRYVLTNGTGDDFSDIRVDICVQGLHVPEINDPESRRTAFPVGGRFRTVRELIPDFDSHDAVPTNGQRFYGYPNGPRQPLSNPAVTPHPGHPDDPARSIYRWTAPAQIDRPAIAIASSNDDWCLVTESDTSTRVWNNPGLSCMHSSPEADSCPSGASVELTNRLHIHEGSLASLHDSLRKETE